MEYPQWVDEVSEATLIRLFGRASLERGRHYAQTGRVGVITSGAGASGSVLQASVRGSGFRVYQALVGQEAHSGRLYSSCSCPVGSGCKHSAALLWQLRLGRREPLRSDWQQALANVVATEPQHDRAAVPLALELVRSSVGVAMRPLMWGKSGRWIRTGVSWDSLRSPSRTPFNEKQRRALSAIQRSQRTPEWQYYGSRTESLELGQLNPEVWPALREALAAGVALVTQSRAPVSVSPEEARVVTRLSRTDGGGLALTTRVIVGERYYPVPLSNLLGNPPHGVVVPADEGVLVAGFEEPLRPAAQAMLLRHPRVDIPEEDLAAFAVGYLPGLRQKVPVVLEADVELPAPEPPRLLLRVGFEPGHVTRLRWQFTYQVGDTTTRIAVDDPAVERAPRDRPAEEQLLAELPQGPWPRDGLRPLDGQLSGAGSAAFVSDGLPLLREHPRVDVDEAGEAPAYRLTGAAPVVSLAVTDPAEGTDWFNLDVTISIDGEQIDFRELFTAIATGQSHLILESGTWFSLDHPELDQLRTLMTEAAALQERGTTGLRLRPEHAGLWEELVSLGVVAEQSEAWRSAASALLDPASLPTLPAPGTLTATLRPYQQDGFDWLARRWQTRLGGILADDMGLGKTVQVLALACAAKERGELDQPLLVVAPTSVMGTWAAEAARFAPELDVRVVTQTSKKRPAGLAETVAGADLVVTSYTLARLDDEEYQQQRWSGVILDEAQFAKNRQSRVYQAVRRLPARVKFAVTGTPLENNLMDLWSLLSITSPGLFAHPDAFTEVYRRPIESGSDPTALARLHRRIRPLMLRRTKEAVAAELPPKQEQVIAVELSPGHRRLYDKQLAAERKKVLGLVEDLNRNRITILRSLTLLRQLSLSPALVDASHPAQSAKLDLLVELVTELAAEGHRALVFSQFTTFLRMARDRLNTEGIGTSYLDGRTRDREARIDAFRNGDDPVFLISLKAGGFGLTLIEADYVFILDPWWNPAAEAQAIDRTHRIGQDKHVNVYRLVSADTIEEKVVALQERKRDLFSRVVGTDSEVAAPLGVDDIRGLLEL